MPMLILGIYALLVLVLHFLGILDPGPNNWGTHFYGYLGSGWLTAGLLTAGGVTAALILVPRKAWDQVAKPGVVVVAALLGGALFWLGREVTYFLGDGAFLIQCIERGVLLWHNEPATLFGQFYLNRALGSPDPALSIGAVSAVCGVLYLGLVGVFARTVASTGWERVVVFLLLATAGFTRLFYGYVETYAVLALLTAGYLTFALRAILGTGSLALPVIIATVAPAFHITGLFLWPSVLVLVARGGKHSTPARWYLLLLPAAAIAAGLVLLGGSPEAIGETYQRYLTKTLPIAGPLGLKTAYTVFSTGHISDFFQEQMTLGPMAALLALLLLILTRPKVLGTEGRFLLWAALPWWVFSFIYSRELGAARDWDLFSAATVPWLFLAGLLWVRLPGPRGAGALFRTATGLMVGVGVFHLVGFVAVDMEEDRSIARFATLNGPGSHPAPWARSYAFEELGTYYLDAADVDGAVGAFTESVLADSTNSRAMAFLGASLRAQGNLEGSLSVLETAARRAPKNASVQFQLGSTYQLSGQPQGALLAFRRAWELDRSNIDVCLNLVTAELAVGETETAERVVREALERYPGEGRLHALLGRVREGYGDTEGALVSYREAVTLGADDPAVHFNIGRLLLQQNQPEAAAAELETQVAAYPADYEAWVNLGAANERLGQTQRAEEAYRRAAVENPRRPEAYFSLARFHLAQADTTAARRALQSYTQVDSTSQQANLARLLLQRLESSAP